MNKQASIHRNLLFLPRSGIEPGTSGNSDIAMTISAWLLLKSKMPALARMRDIKSKAFHPFQKHPPKIVLPVEQVKSKREAEPNANESKFFGRRVQHRIEDFESKNHPKQCAGTAEKYGVPFQSDFHPENGECCSAHACN